MSARKHLEEIPNSSGIYQIRCNQNGKIYVGSAVSLQARWCMHRRELRRGLHHNPHLQHAWNLHDEASFEFTILELVEAPQLLIREQWWISQTRCTDHRIGFNVNLQATTAGDGVGQSWPGFRDPAGGGLSLLVERAPESRIYPPSVALPGYAWSTCTS